MLCINHSCGARARDRQTGTQCNRSLIFFIAESRDTQAGRQIHRLSSVPFRRTMVIAGLDWTGFWGNSSIIESNPQGLMGLFCLKNVLGRTTSLNRERNPLHFGGAIAKYLAIFCKQESCRQVGYAFTRFLPDYQSSMIVSSVVVDHIPSESTTWIRRRSAGNKSNHHHVLFD